MSEGAPPADLLVVLVSAPEDAAERLSRGLVSERLAACVAMHPMRSIYHWNGAIEMASEVQLVIKTAAPFEAVRAWIRANHPYDVPEIIALQIHESDGQYAAWLRLNAR